MDLYGQEPEARLLASFLPRLESRVVIDVGAERGAFAEEMLQAGAEELHLVEPEPENAAFLRERFAGDSRVTVHEYALGDKDQELRLHKSVSPSGQPISFGHTLLERPATDEIAWPETIEVTGRSLESLAASGELPARAGILKIDTEGYDFEVVAALGRLDCDIVMVEHWSNLPHSLGPCPWTTEEMASMLRGHGFSHFAFVVHRGPYSFLKWDDGETSIGSMGNLVFLRDRVVDRLLPLLLELGSALAELTVEAGERYSAAAEERLALIHELERACEERLRVIEELETAVRSMRASGSATSGTE